MWFYPLLGLLVMLGLAGGVLLGGVYTIILVPLAVIVVVSSVVYAMWGRALQGSRGGATGATSVAHDPLPAQRTSSAGRAPTSPEALADARRESQ